MKLILYVSDTDKAIEAVVAARSMDKHPESRLIGIRMTSGTVYSIERRRTDTLTVRQMEER
jgi:hypothetical protein